MSVTNGAFINFGKITKHHGGIIYR